MYDYLVDHALKNVWCTPDQDLQAVVRPARLTPPVGAFNQVQVLWTTYVMPERATRFHVYMIGQLHPSLMGLLGEKEKWTTLAAACNASHLMADVYVNSGVQLPRTQVWFQVTKDRNLILAVKDQPRTPINMLAEDVFLRVYTNAYFSTTRANLASDVVHVEGGTALDAAWVLALQASFERYQKLPGLCSAYVNGFLVPSISLLTVKTGDCAEFVFDGSVKKVVDFKISELRDFTSTLDAKHKYLLHPPKKAEAQTIDYQDDLDFFLVNPALAGFQGVYYHRNQADAVRMVTHRDYALPTAYIAGYTQKRTDWPELTALVIRMVVRKSGWERPLVYEDSRIHELYKLSDAAIVGAMVGVDATVPTWVASALEASAYVQTMRSQAPQVTPALVEQAYGYNAISSLLAATPKLARVFSSQKVVDVPYGLQSRSTGYEHDAAGTLTGYYTHTEGSTYPCRNAQTALVEMVSGDASDRLDEVYGQQTMFLDPLASYRMYTCPIEFGVPTNRWVDVTGSGKYGVVSNRLTWTTDPLTTYTLVRSDRTMLGYTLSLSAQTGVLRFTLTARQLRGNTLSTWPLQIPLGELDLWLNGRALIEGLDYFVKFPMVVVVNKEYLVDPANKPQRIDVRFSGFCKSTLTRELPTDVGFVQYGQLSHNDRFDLRDDKVLRITVDGQVYDRSELTFSETNPAVRVLDQRNGSPYQIRDIVVPLRGYTDSNTYALRAHAKTVDTQVSDYLSLKSPQDATPQPNAIPERYTLYSPFLNALIRDMKTGVFQFAQLKDYYSDMDVKAALASYEWLLEFDPTHVDRKIDERWVLVHPHNEPNVVEINLYHYKFAARAAALYLRGRVSLTSTMRMTAV